MINGILSNDTGTSQEPVAPKEQYLVINKALSELSDKGLALEALFNLGLIGTEERPGRLEQLETSIQEAVTSQVFDIVNQLNSLEATVQNLDDIVRGDESTIAHISDLEEKLDKRDFENHRESISNQIEKIQEKITNLKNLHNDDRKNLQEQLDNLNQSYQELSQNAVTLKVVQKLLDEYQGSNKPFIVGTPVRANHAVNRGWVSNLLTRHTSDKDAHDIPGQIKSKLQNYYKKSEVYPRNQVYTKDEINNKIYDLVDEAIGSSIETHINDTPHLDNWDVRKIVEEFAKSNLISKSDLSATVDSINEEIKSNQPIWKTSGPVLTTVGFVEDNTELPEEVTLQEILDQIFYGSKISISADETVTIGDSTDVTICVHSGIPTDAINLYQNGELIETYLWEDFAEGCKTITSTPITENTTFKVEVVFSNGMIQEESVLVKAIPPIFVGIIPKFQSGCNLSYDRLQDLIRKDKVNNKIVKEQSKTVEHHYNFIDPKYKKLFIAVPAENYELVQMVTPSQQFGVDAFDVCIFPIRLPNINRDIHYKMYIYKQALSNMNLNVSFNFK